MTRAIQNPILPNKIMCNPFQALWRALKTVTGRLRSNLREGLRFLHGFAFLLLGCAAPVTLSAANISWTNTVGGNGSVAANWNPNTVPGANDSVSISMAGTYTVILGVSVTVSNLTLGGNILGTQTLSNSANNLTVRNAGAITGTTTFLMKLFNTGNVNIQSGAIDFGRGGNMGGSFTAAPGSTNIFSDTCIFDAMPNFTGNVPFGVNTPIYFTVPISNFNFTGGILTGTNTIIGTLNWTGGELAGICTVATGAVVNISGSGGKSFGNSVMTNFGTVIVTNTASVGGRTWTFYNRPGGLFDIKAAVVFSARGTASHE